MFGEIHNTNQLGVINKKKNQKQNNVTNVNVTVLIKLTLKHYIHLL